MARRVPDLCGAAPETKLNASLEPEQAKQIAIVPLVFVMLSDWQMCALSGGRSSGRSGPEA
jgi:hypothetical protein